jgi:tyrosine-protein phosphatase YwqE
MSAAIADLGWDLHAHLIPGVDDGVKTTEEALESILSLQRLGYSGCVLTPHIYKEVHNNCTATLRPAFDRLHAAVQQRGIDFGLILAAEYFADDHLVRLAQTEPLLSFGPASRRYVLIEYPYIGEPLAWADPLSAVTRAGYIPVIAHPERYRYFVSEPDRWLDRFGPYAVQYQCEIGSLGEQYGPTCLKMAKALLKARIPTFWGTDLHRPSHIERFIVPGLKVLRRNALPLNIGLIRAG